MFSSTLLKFTLCAILASVVGVHAQDGPVFCNNLPTAPLQDCKDVVDTLRTSNQVFVEEGGQANFTQGACTGRVLFGTDISSINALAFAENLQPILDNCGNSDPMSGERPQGINPAATGFQLFGPSDNESG